MTANKQDAAELAIAETLSYYDDEFPIDKYPDRESWPVSQHAGGITVGQLRALRQNAGAVDVNTMVQDCFKNVPKMLSAHNHFERLIHIESTVRYLASRGLIKSQEGAEIAMLRGQLEAKQLVINQLEAQLSQPQRVGWVLVPEEPTGKMLCDFYTPIREFTKENCPTLVIEEGYSKELAESLGELHTQFSSQYKIPCIVPCGEKDASKIMRHAMVMGAIFIEDTEKLFCVVLRPDIGPELWSKQALIKSMDAA